MTSNRLTTDGHYFLVLLSLPHQSQSKMKVRRKKVTSNDTPVSHIYFNWLLFLPFISLLFFSFEGVRDGFLFLIFCLFVFELLPVFYKRLIKVISYFFFVSGLISLISSYLYLSILFIYLFWVRDNSSTWCKQFINVSMAWCFLFTSFHFFVTNLTVRSIWRVASLGRLG